MKLVYIKSFVFAGLLAGLSSCSTIYSSIEAPRPMDLNNLNDIDSVAIINRTGFNKDNNAKRILEGIVTGEAIGADANAARKCVTGLFDFLSHSLNYKRTVLSDDLFTTSNEYRFGDPMPWDTVIALCNEFDVEALFVLEYFDSNNGISTVADGVNIGLNGVLAPPPVNPTVNNRQTVVKLGWRIYVPKTMEIRDQYDFKQGFHRPPVPSGYDNYRQKYGAIQGAGYEAGIDYSFRTSDQIVLEGRTLFRKGTASMKQASRMVQAGLWDQAAETWMAESGNAKRKVRARALHNLSVYAERQGNLQLAKEHAQNAYANKAYGLTMTQLSNIQRRMDYEHVFAERSAQK